MNAAEGFEAVLQDAAEGLLDQVAGDEGGGVDGAFLFAATAGLARINRGGPVERSRVAADVSRRTRLPGYMAPTYVGGYVTTGCRAGIAEQATEDLGQEVRKQFLSWLFSESCG